MDCSLSVVFYGTLMNFQSHFGPFLLRQQQEQQQPQQWTLQVRLADGLVAINENEKLVFELLGSLSNIVLCFLCIHRRDL